jgi:DNA-binding IclR family transcriptional regulator
MSKSDASVPDGENRPFVTALARGLAVLSCFDRPRVELTVSEIARRVGLSQATTWRLCATLIECGFLVRGRGAALRVGAPALTLGYAAIQGMDLPSIALPHMQQLAERSGATISLSLRRGIEIVSVEQSTGDFVLPNQPVGWATTLTSSSAGLAVLAVLPEEEHAAMLAQLEARDPGEWPRRRERVEAARLQFAHEGFVTRPNMFDGQYASAAVPLIEGQGDNRRYWAISSGGLRSRMDDQRLAGAAAELKRLRELLQPAASALG